MAKTTDIRGDSKPNPSAARPETSDTPTGSAPNVSPRPHASESAVRAEAAKALEKAVASDTDRRRLIEEGAYYRAERRGFAPGREQEDWLEAEKEVDRGTPTDKDVEANDFPSPK